MNFHVIVTVELRAGATPKSAEINRDDLRDHEYDIEAVNRFFASEKALSLFHASVPIGVLDDVEITTHTVPSKKE